MPSDMKISGVGGPKSTDKAKRKRPAGGDAFAEDLAAVTGSDSSEPAAPPVRAGALGGIGAVLAAQEVGDATQGRSKGLLMQRGNRLLDRLEDLQMALLSGTLPKAKVIELAQALREKRPQSDDAELNGLLDEIEMRAEIELAKLAR